MMARGDGEGREIKARGQLAAAKITLEGVGELADLQREQRLRLDALATEPDAEGQALLPPAPDTTALPAAERVEAEMEEEAEAFLLVRAKERMSIQAVRQQENL